MFIHPIVVLDFETTGLYAEDGDRVTEVAALRIEEGKVTRRFDSLVNSGHRIPRSISHFTHISQAMIDAAPESAAVFAQLLHFIGDDPVFAHNAAFDQAFLSNECRLASLSPPTRDFFCSVQLARHLYPQLQTHALGPLALSLGIRTRQRAHRAGADAELTAEVLLEMARQLCVMRGRPYLHAAELTALYAADMQTAA